MANIHSTSKKTYSETMNQYIIVSYAISISFGHVAYHVIKMGEVIMHLATPLYKILDQPLELSSCDLELYLTVPPAS
jgi:hypothetical protein